MTGAPPLPDPDALLAAELAFGLLDDADRRQAEARLADDPAFAGAHRWWLDQAVTLLAGEEVAAPASVWTAVERRLPANDDVARGAGALRAWQAATGVAAAVALGLGIVVARTPSPIPAPPTPAVPPVVVSVGVHPRVAVLDGEDSRAVVAVSYDPASRTLVATPSRLDLARRAAELWVILPGAKPRSLGVIDQATPSAGSTAALLPAGATLAVSVEPAGGSPTGQPTGPVILTGKIVAT